MFLLRFCRILYSTWEIESVRNFKIICKKFFYFVIIIIIIFRIQYDKNAIRPVCLQI